MTFPPTGLITRIVYTSGRHPQQPRPQKPDDAAITSPLVRAAFSADQHPDKYGPV